MSPLDALIVWAQAREAQLAERGIATIYGRTDDDRPKPSAYLNLRRRGTEADLVMWDTGEAEVHLVGDGRTSGAAHEDIVGLDDLNGLLARMLAMFSQNESADGPIPTCPDQAPTRFPDLDAVLRRTMVSFGERVKARRHDLRYTISQPASIHYSSRTLLDFLSDAVDEDLLVADATLDMRSGSPTWSIDITTGDGRFIAEMSVPPGLAAAFVEHPDSARAAVEAFLDANFGKVIDHLAHVTW